MKSWTFGALLVCALATAAHAGQQPTAVASIVTEQQKIRSEVQAGAGVYREMPQAKRSELLAKQDQLLELIAGKESTAQLDAGQQAEAHEAMQWIASTIASVKDDQMVCERRPILGSNRKERVCRTAAQARREREYARERMDTRSVDRP